MSYDITISISEVETNDYDRLEVLCEMMAEVCESICRKCDYDTVRRFGLADYELKEVKDE